MFRDSPEPGVEPALTYSRDHWIMVAIVALACVALSQGERIPAAGGLGFDGIRYAAIVREPASVLADKYYVQRALPSWVVHVILRVFRRPLDDRSVILAFLAINVVLLTGSVMLWRPIANRLALGACARWLGFIGIFANVAVLKMPFYDPVLTDVWALALGMLGTFAAVTARRWLLTLVILVCMFTWPIGAVLGLPLLLWPTGVLPRSGNPESRTLGTLAGCVAAAMYLAWFVALYVVLGQKVRVSSLAVPVVAGVVWLGIALSMAYIVSAVRCLLAGVTVRYCIAAMRGIQPLDIVLALAVMAPARIMVALFGEGLPIVGARQYIGHVVLLGSSRPLLFAVAAITYVGPVLLLLAFSTVRVRFLELVREFGPGWRLFVVGAVGLSLSSETRQELFQYPAIVALIAAAADRARIPGRVAWLLAGVSLILSKFWLRINLEPGRMVDFTDPRLGFHYRRYFMNHGPWMANDAYVLHTVVIAAVTVALCLVMRTRPPARQLHPFVGELR